MFVLPDNFLLHTAPIQLQPNGWKTDLTTVQQLQLTGERIHRSSLIWDVLYLPSSSLRWWNFIDQAISLPVCETKNNTALQTNDGEPPLIPISNSQPLFPQPSTSDSSTRKIYFCSFYCKRTNYFKCKLAEHWPAGCLWGCRVWISMGKCSLLRMISWFLPVNLLALLMLLVCQSVQ